MTSLVDAVVHSLGKPGVGLALRGGAISGVFEQGRSPTGRRMSGAHIVPGFCDSHLHLMALGVARRELDLSSARSLEDVLERVAEAHRNTPPGVTIRGSGWNAENWQSAPDRMHLDRVAPGRSIVLLRSDYHSAWVSSPLLSGVDFSSVSDQVELREDQTPTGVLRDDALDAVVHRIAHGTGDQGRADLAAAFSVLLAHGVTAAHDTACEEHLWELLQSCDTPLRIAAYGYGAAATSLDWVRDAVKESTPEKLALVGIKIFLDGALASRGAWLLQPYADRPSTCGSNLASTPHLEERIALARELGLPVALHAIGDRAVSAALKLARDMTVRLEHAELVAPSDRPEFTLLHACSMQPGHAVADLELLKSRVGQERRQDAFPWASLPLKHLCFGSDAPTGPIDPLLGLRVLTQGVAGGWPTPISFTRALDGYTKVGHWAARWRHPGTLTVGAPADFVVLDRHPLEPGCQVEETWIAGERVYAR